MRPADRVSLVVACLLLLGARTRAASTDHKCLAEQNTRLKIKNVLYIDNQPSALRIAAGSRPTERMLALLLRDMLQQWLGYEKVELQEGDYDYQGWLNATNCNVEPGQHGNCSNTPMVHISLAEPEDQDGVFDKYQKFVYPLGELGPRLRRGWFVSSSVVNSTITGRRPDMWVYFTNPALASLFGINEKRMDTYIRNKDRSWCDQEKFPLCDHTCQFVPDRCRGNETCATLLAAFPHESYGALVKQIRELGLYVKVAWLGSEFERLLRYRPNSTLFFDYSISPLTYDRNEVTEVLFPSCDSSGQPRGCIYHSVKLKKFIWSFLKHKAKPVYRLVESFVLTTNEYVELVRAYKNEVEDKELLTVVCNVAKDYWTRMIRWTENVSIYPQIVVHTIVRSNESTVSPAVELAINAINNDESLLRRFYMNQTIIRGDCDQDTVWEGFKKSVKESDDATIAVIGPECNRSLETLLSFTKHSDYALAVISYQMDNVTLTGAGAQSNFFRLAPDSSIVYTGYMHLIRHFDWHNFAHFFEEKYVGDLNALQAKARRNNMTIEMAHYGNEEDTARTLMTIKEKGNRIIVADFHRSLGIRVMCDAFRLNMTWRENYVWIFPPWLPKGWFNVSGESLPGNCTADHLESAMNLTFTYHFKEVEEDDFETNAGYPTVREWKRSINTSISPCTGYAYDAIWTLAKSLNMATNTTIPSLEDPAREEFLRGWLEIIQHNSFDGVTGQVSFTRNTRKPQQIELDRYVGDGQYKFIGYFLQTKPKTNSSDARYDATAARLANGVDNDGELKMINEVTWPLGRPFDKETRQRIPDKRDCHALIPGLDTLVPCDKAMILSIVFIVIISVVVLTSVPGYLLYRHYKLKMKSIEQQHQALPFSNLSEYELQPDRVRIYRSLGEGAFGKVYLGEYQKEETCVLAVAVKAAKDPKNNNAKMELLSEAEVMKRFEHINILQLIGVITQRDKCMIVTEFMMYGNLKSYLQDRRHLAIKLEIDAAHLTRMALDISRGLSYLASLNYVHGDLACRNCLVHETLTIKIADFGFCKNLVDQDYYRLVRSGPMPVRWMSPELLSTGVYHVQSDIWSFGVVLYEIITFGAYPYGDMDDHQVQNYIRSGGFPSLPQKLSSKLEALFLRIWTLKKEDRPSALELFEILAADPTLVHPSLEESPSRVDYISLEGRRHSRGSMSVRGNVSKRARSPHSTLPRMKNEAIEMIRLDAL